MKTIASLQIAPLGGAKHMTKEICSVLEVLDKHKLQYEVGPTSTAVVGELDQVLAAIKACHETLHQHEVPRVLTQVSLDTRQSGDVPGLRSMVDKVTTARHGEK